MKHKVFFILSVGRCGSLWLARLLSRGENALVLHEIDVPDRKAFLEAYSSEAKAFAYVRNYRAPLINRRMKKAFVYGEVNGVLRYHVKALRAYFPHAEYLNLVRDGRDVIRSWYSRDTLNGRDDLSGIVPRKGDPARKAWPKFSRFSRLCWFWASESRHIRMNISGTIQFERLISDYDYFRDKLLSRIGISISPETWDGVRKIRENSSSKYRLPHHSVWSVYQRTFFETLAGPENRANGYE